MIVMDIEVCGVVNIIYFRYCLKFFVDVEMKNFCIVVVCKVFIYVYIFILKERGEYCFIFVFLFIISYCCSFFSSDFL